MSSRRRRTRLSSSVGRVTNMTTMKLAIAITRNNNNRAMSGCSGSDFQRMLEKVGRQHDARSLEAFGKLGHHSRGMEAAQYLACQADATLLEEKDVLHAYDVIVHPRDLADMGDVAGAIAHARYLDDDVDGRG